MKKNDTKTSHATVPLGQVMFMNAHAHARPHSTRRIFGQDVVGVT
jgi:hypothetical protein